MPIVSTYDRIESLSLEDLLYVVDDEGGSPLTPGWNTTLADVRDLIQANLTQIVGAGVLNAATGNERAWDLSYTVNKATSGNDTGLYMNKVDTNSPGTSNLIECELDGSLVFRLNDTGEFVFGTPGLKSYQGVTLSLISNASWTIVRNVLIISDPVSAADTRLYRDAAHIFNMRNGANPYELRISALHTDASNYEWLSLTGAAVTVETAGTGADNIDLTLTPAGTGKLVFGGNGGTAGTGTTAVEHGDGHNMITVLTMAGVLPAIAGGAALAVGLLVYTFPAGVTRVKSVHMDVGITQSEGNINADTPEVGVGSVIATGAVAVLNATAGFDDYVVEQTAANCTGTVTDKSEDTAVAGLQLNEAGGVKALHLNAADNWAASGDSAATLSGTITIEWAFLGA